MNPAEQFPNTRERRQIAQLIALYTVILSGLTVARFLQVQAYILDWSVHEQPLWLQSQGQVPFVTVRGLHFMADHFQPLVYLFVPIYWLWSSPALLLVLQAAGIGLGALPIYLLARANRLGHREGLFFSALYLVQPSILHLNDSDIHWVAFAPTFFLFAIWALEAGRPLVYGLSLLMAGLTSESMTLPVIFLSFNALRIRGRWWALATAGGGLGLLVFAMKCTGYFNHGASSSYISLFAPYGKSPGAILKQVFTHPLETALPLLNWNTFSYFLVLLAPLAFLPLLAPSKSVAAIPVLGGNLLNWRESQLTVTHQYGAGLLPFFIWSAIHGWALARERIDEPRRRLERPAVLLLCFLILFTVGPWIYHRFEGGDRPRIVAVLRAIPPESSVSAENRVGGQLARRKELYLFPNPFQKMAWGNRPQALVEQAVRECHPLSPGAFRRAQEATEVEFVVLEPGLASSFPLRGPDRHYYYQELKRSRTFGLVKAEAGTVIFSRGQSHQATGPSMKLRPGADGG